MDITTLLPTFIAIPTAPFLMGTPERDLSDLAKCYGGTRESYREESPQHEVTLPEFAIAQVPVTNALYAAFVSAANVAPPLHWHGSQPPADCRDLPATNVSWEEAQAFCDWLSGLKIRDWRLEIGQGLSRHQTPISHFQSLAVRLPGEAEWEHVARGPDGRAFPWGDVFDPQRANTRETGVAGATPVGQYAEGASPYGVLDMAGNVWEWTASLDRPYPYDASDGRENRYVHGRRILRGGCYANPQGFARCACRFRLLPGVRNEFIGFRLALELR